MSKKKRTRSSAKTALREHCLHAWRPDARTIRDADALAKSDGMRGAELAAAAVMLSLATPQALADSRWLDPALKRAVSLVGIDPFTATTVLDRVIRDLHRRGVVTGPDAIAQLCNVEMRRRSLGCEPRCIELPCARPGEPDNLLESAAMWETAAYAEGFVMETMIDSERWPAVTAAIFFIVRDLAETTGVPVRIETMVPARIAEIFANHETPLGYEPIPTSELFEAATDFVIWLGERRILSPERTPALTRQLRALTEKAKRETRVRSGAC